MPKGKAGRYGSQVREVINRNTVISLALEQGFNAFIPVYDGGVDFILYRESDGGLRKVQLKGRWTIDRVQAEECNRHQSNPRQRPIKLFDCAEALIEIRHFSKFLLKRIPLSLCPGLHFGIADGVYGGGDVASGALLQE